MGSTRYVSVSERTTIMAKGILLYARYQNMGGSLLENNPATVEWDYWKLAYPDWVDFVQKEQFSLFNRVAIYAEYGDNYSHKERLQKS